MSTKPGTVNIKRLSVPPPPPKQNASIENEDNKKGRMSLPVREKPNTGKKSLKIPPPPPSPKAASASCSKQQSCSIPPPPAHSKEKRPSASADNSAIHQTHSGDTTRTTSNQSSHTVDDERNKDSPAPGAKEKTTRLSLLPPPPARSKKNVSTQTDSEDTTQSAPSQGVSANIAVHRKKRQEIRTRLNQIEITAETQKEITPSSLKLDKQMVTVAIPVAQLQEKSDQQMLTVCIPTAQLQQLQEQPSLSSPNDSPSPNSSMQQLNTDPQCRYSCTGTANSPSNSSETKSVDKDLLTPTKRTQRRSTHSMDRKTISSTDSNVDDTHGYGGHEQDDRVVPNVAERNTDTSSKSDSCKGQRSFSGSQSQKVGPARRDSNQEGQGQLDEQAVYQPRPANGSEKKPEKAKVNDPLASEQKKTRRTRIQSTNDQTKANRNRLPTDGSTSDQNRANRNRLPTDGSTSDQTKASRNRLPTDGSTSDQNKASRDRLPSDDLLSGFDDDGELTQDKQECDTQLECAQGAHSGLQSKHCFSRAKPRRATMLSFTPVDPLSETEGGKGRVAKRRSRTDSHPSSTNDPAASSTSSMATSTCSSTSTDISTTVKGASQLFETEDAKSVLKPEYNQINLTKSTPRKNNSLLSTPKTAKSLTPVAVMDDVDEDQDQD